MIEDLESLAEGDLIPDHIVEFYDWSCLSCFLNDPDYWPRMIYRGHWWDEDLQCWEVEIACAGCENLWVEHIDVTGGE